MYILDCSCLIMPVLSLVKKFINLVKILVPIALIIWGIIDMAKAMMAFREDEMKKAQSSLINKLFAAVCVFLVPTVLNIVLDIVATGTKGEVDTGNWATCWTNAEELAGSCSDGGSTNIGSYCYLCGTTSSSQYMWTNNPGSNCSKQDSITSENACLSKNNCTTLTDGNCYTLATTSCLGASSNSSSSAGAFYDEYGDKYCFLGSTYLTYRYFDGSTDDSLEPDYEWFLEWKQSNPASCPNDYSLLEKTIEGTDQYHDGRNLPSYHYYRICAALKTYKCSNGQTPYEYMGKYWCKVD